MDKLLDHEKFEGAETLAQIGTEIAKGRAILAEIETTKEQYLNEREKETVERIRLALVASKDILTEIGQYHNELEGYRKEVMEYVATLRYLLEGVTGLKDLLTQVTTGLRQELADKQQEIDEGMKQLKAGRETLAAERVALQGDKDKLATDKLSIDDAWKTLERSAQELNIKYKKV